MDAGAQPLGWKLGAGSPAAMAKLDIEGPLVGYLLEGGQIGLGSHRVGGRMDERQDRDGDRGAGGEQLAPGFTLSDCERAISAIALAFELVDVDAAGASAEEMLRRNVFNRAVVLGGWVATQDDPPVSVALGDQLVTDAVDPLAAVGDLAELVRHVAEVLAAIDASLAPGSADPAGAVTLPPPCEPRPALDRERADAGWDRAHDRGLTVSGADRPGPRRGARWNVCRLRGGAVSRTMSTTAGAGPDLDPLRWSGWRPRPTADPGDRGRLARRRSVPRRARSAGAGEGAGDAGQLRGHAIAAAATETPWRLRPNAGRRPPAGWQQADR